MSTQTGRTVRDFWDSERNSVLDISMSLLTLLFSVAINLHGLEDCNKLILALILSLIIEIILFT